MSDEQTPPNVEGKLAFHGNLRMKVVRGSPWWKRLWRFLVRV